MLITRDELERSADVFSIELLDMKNRHRVLLGVDLVASCRFRWCCTARNSSTSCGKADPAAPAPAGDSRDESRTWHLLLRSLPLFTTLFRHALITQGQPETGTSGID